MPEKTEPASSVERVEEKNDKVGEMSFGLKNPSAWKISRLTKKTLKVLETFRV